MGILILCDDDNKFPIKTRCLAVQIFQKGLLCALIVVTMLIELSIQLLEVFCCYCFRWIEMEIGASWWRKWIRSVSSWLEI